MKQTQMFCVMKTFRGSTHDIITDFTHVCVCVEGEGLEFDKMIQNQRISGNKCSGLDMSPTNKRVESSC